MVLSIRLAFVLGLMLISASSSHAMAGNELLKICSAMKDGAEKQAAYQYVCIGYIRGYQDAHTIMAALAATKAQWASEEKAAPERPLTDDEINSHSSFCIPEGADNAEQLARVIVLYLENHAKELHIPAGFLVMSALQDAFPCWKK